MNLLDFSKMVQTFFKGSFISSFQNWEAEFEYITGKISDEKLVLIIDEFSMVDSLLFSHLLLACQKVSQILLIGDDQQFPFLAEPNPSMTSGGVFL